MHLVMFIFHNLSAKQIFPMRTWGILATVYLGFEWLVSFVEDSCLTIWYMDYRVAKPKRFWLSAYEDVSCTWEDYCNLFVTTNIYISRMKPVFCGNFEYDSRQSEIERLFARYGKVDRVDMKSENVVSRGNLLSQIESKYLKTAELRMLGSFADCQGFNVSVSYLDGKEVDATIVLMEHVINLKSVMVMLSTSYRRLQARLRSNIIFLKRASVLNSFFGAGIFKRLQALLGLWAPVHIPSSCQGYFLAEHQLLASFNKAETQMASCIPSCFAFIYMEDERDAEDAIRNLDNTEFGRQRRRLCVEWTKVQADRVIRRSEGGKRTAANLKPAKTLFVINFDPVNTRVRDLERHFEPYGKLLNVRIRRNFAFIQYESQEEATKALDSTNMSKVLDRVISVEYAARDDGDRRDGRASPVRRSNYGRYSERGSRDRLQALFMTGTAADHRLEGQGPEELIEDGYLLLRKIYGT
eukprot:Gb_02054 [translate_table: standard]